VIQTLIALFLCGLLAEPELAQRGIEQRKIEYLISAVAELHDATFIRNGSEYDSRQAAKHLRSKLGYAGSRVKTAEDFITWCATGSSLSSEKYRIRFSDGRVRDTADYLRDKLARYEMAH